MKNGFPVEVLPQCSSVLSVFSAAFLGRNDIEFIHKAGITDCFLVDRDKEKLEGMKTLFGYGFHCGDAFEFVRNHKKKYDLVITDQWSSMDSYTWDNRELFLNLATKYLIMGICYEQKKYNQVPEGEFFHRSDNFGGVFWHLTKL